MGPKSRWIIQGFHDPDIALLNRSVPTPATSDVPFCIQILASIQANIWSADVKGAFTQGLRGQRPDRLFASPPEGGIPGEDDDIIIELCTEVYGLITGPPCWRRRLLTTLQELGFKRHPLAPCVFLMYTPQEAICGLICVETDDLLGGGCDSAFFDAIEVLKKRYNFGAWHDLREKPREYGGRTLHQKADKSVEISMVRYLEQGAREIRLEKGRCKDPESPCTASEITAMRGLTGKLNWAARMAMPNGAGDASILSSTLPTPQIKDIQAANAALRRLLAQAATITIKPIPLERIRLLMFSDSGLGSKTGHSNIGHLICAVDKSIRDGVEADTSILCWTSHKTSRSGSSTLLCEANAMSEGLADAEWCATWLGLAKSPKYDIRKRDTLNRDIQVTTSY